MGLTPLIDVVFILLLFFMLTSRFADRRRLDMATPAPSPVLNLEDKVIVLNLTPEGLQLDDRPLPLDQIDTILHARLATGDPVRLTVAAGVGLETCVTVMDALKASGARSIALNGPEGLQ